MRICDASKFISCELIYSVLCYDIKVLYTNIYYTNISCFFIIKEISIARKIHDKTIIMIPVKLYQN